MTIARPLRAGLIGLGSMGRNHARMLDSLAGVDLAGVADPAGDPHRNAHGAPVFTSVSALIDNGLDYCVVAAPTSLHEQIGTELAQAGVHMLVEKPVASDSAAAIGLAKIFDAAGLIGAVGHIERYNPALQQLKARLANGDLGDIYQVATRRQGPFPARIADVGVVFDLATHDLDLTMWITDQPFAAISAQTSHKSGRQHEDLVAATGLLADGTPTNHLVNWLSPMKERVTVVTGDKGTYVADTLTADLTFHANGTVALDWEDIAHFRGMTEGDVVRYAFSKMEPLRREHEAFRDAVLGNDSDIVTLQQGFAAVQVAESVIEAARTNRTVALTS
ncbi:MAG TPA: Gfo/Idh/MocA family oxidoreductase [Jatrophihabitans sp.]|jgi:predicted dehydrogenase